MSENIAEAITAKNEVIAEQGTSLDAVLTALEGKAAGGSDLANVSVYIADFHKGAETSVTIGALDKYARIVVS